MSSITAPGLSKNAFLRAQQFVFQHTGADEQKLRDEFRILGYSPRYPTAGCTSDCGRIGDETLPHCLNLLHINANPSRTSHF